MIADNGKFPFSMVEDPDFRDMTRVLVRLFAPKSVVYFPSRRSVVRSVIDIVVATNESERAEFKNTSRQLYPFTNDSTTSRAGYNYTCLTSALMDVSTYSHK